MTIPDKPITIDLDSIGLDAWIGFTEVAAQLQALRGSDMATLHQALTGARAILVAFLYPSWTEQEIGALNMAEMKDVIGQIGQGMRGPNAMSDSPSTPPTAMAGRSPSAPGSAASPKNGRVPRGKLRPSSA
jgi:hypothetical protein